MDELEQYKSYLLANGAHPEDVNQYVTEMRQKMASQPIAESDIQNEMPSWLDTNDRMKIKNFAQSPETGVKYLESKYPDAEFRVQDGQTLMRKKGEGKFQVLDPSGFSLTDLPHDIADVGYDVVDSAATGLGTAAGGVAGTFVAPGAGTLGGASLGGAVTGAASEAARQKIGQELGIPQEVDGTDVAISAGVNALSPLLFGTGAETKHLAKALLARGEQSSEKELLERAAKLGRGGFERAWDFGKDKALPTIGSIVSGKSKESITNLGKNLDYVNAFDGPGGEQRLVDEANRVAEKFGSQFSAKKAEVGGELAKDIKAAGRQVDLSDASKAFQSKADEIAERSTRHGAQRTEAEQAQIDYLLEAKDRIFGNNQNVDADRAWSMQGELVPMMKTDMNPGLTQSGKRVPSQKLRQGAAQESYGAINTGIDKATEGLSSANKSKYQNIVQLQDDLAPYFPNEGKTLQTLRTLDSENKLPVKANIQRAKDAGIDMTDDLSKLQAASQWSNAGWLPKSSGGVTSTSRSVPLSLAGSAAGFYLGSQLGGPGSGAVGGAAGLFGGAVLGGPRMVKNYVKAARTLDRGGKVTAKNVARVLESVGMQKNGKINAATKSVYQYLKSQEDEQP